LKEGGLQRIDRTVGPISARDGWDQGGRDPEKRGGGWIIDAFEVGDCTRKRSRGGVKIEGGILLKRKKKT